MAIEALSEAFLDLLENNRRVGKSVTEIYRVGGVKLVEQGLSGRLGARGERISTLLVDGIDKASARVVKVVDKVHGSVSKTVVGVAARVGELESAKTKSYLAFVGKVNLPAVKAASAVSGKLADGVEKLYAADSGKAASKAERKTGYRRRATKKGAKR
jgi:hypothetical protein